jgi:hypothetical protein
MVEIVPTSKADPDLQSAMRRHYSQPRGFVGRQLFYRIEHEGACYGFIAFGSATKFLPGRKVLRSLKNGMNNIFYHVEKRDGQYPLRNFTTQALLLAENVAVRDYKNKYGNKVLWLETLVELPRTGELYRRAGYSCTGQTKGYTCKRVGGVGTDTWSGKRVWDTENLRPKLVFVKVCNG